MAHSSSAPASARRLGIVLRFVPLLSLLACSAEAPTPVVAAATSDAAADAGPDQEAPPPESDAALIPFDAVSELPPPKCDPPAVVATAPTVVISPTFQTDYQVYELGPVPGIPASALGGCTVDAKNPNALLVAVRSESANGALYSVPLKREECGHISGFAGDATLVANTPYVDANVVYGPNQVLFYTQWPVNKIGQLLPGANTPSLTVELAPLGVGGTSPGGLGFVPPDLADPGGMRLLTWSSGNFYHVPYSATPQGTFSLATAQKTVTIPNGPGGFAYVPKGSPGFTKQGLIVPEWNANSVAVYDVDSVGDPVVATRRPFFTAFPRPWGAYFEPETGDFIFLTWGGSNVDKIYIVRGFTRPPPPPPSPK